jgi:hypothetical protein
MRRSLPLLITLVCLLLATSGVGADQQAEAVDTQTTAPAAVAQGAATEPSAGPPAELSRDPAEALIIGDCCMTKSDCPDDSPYVKLVECDCGYYCTNPEKPCGCTYRIIY